jgi:hypothetical protein
LFKASFAQNGGVIRRSIPFLAVTAGIFCLGLFELLSGPPENVYEDMIVSVLQRGDTNMVSTLRSGLYQASESEKVWRKLPTPPSMPVGGTLAQESPALSRLLYFTGHDSEWGLRDTKGSLFVSDDAGKNWTATSLDQNVLDAFAHPNGFIFAVTDTLSTTPLPGQNESQWAFTTGIPGVKYYEDQYLLVSRDKGQTWRDITPAKPLHFGLYGIFRDPDHPNLVCVRSAQIGHSSRTFFYQADDSGYHWKEIPFEQWPGNRFPGEDGFTLSGNVVMPAYLENFFKYPYPRSGRYPVLPTSYLTAEKPAYSFHLHQPMLVKVSTFFMEPGPPLKIIDNTDAKVFWGLKIQPKGGNIVFANPQTAELNIAIPDWDAKKAAYLRDPHLFTVEADQAHPYQRVIDLHQLYDFSKPGEYRLAIFINSISLDRTSGSALGTLGIDVSIIP